MIRPGVSEQKALLHGVRDQLQRTAVGGGGAPLVLQAVQNIGSGGVEQVITVQLAGRSKRVHALQSFGSPTPMAIATA